MKIAFQMRGKTVTLSRLEEAVAVRKKPGTTVTQLVREFATVRADDDSQGGGFGVDLPASNRKLFERAGWVFVASREPISAAAEMRSTLQNTAVRPVFVDRGGTTLIGTDLVVAQLPPDLTRQQVATKLRSAHLRLVRHLNFAKNLVEASLPGTKPFADAIAELQDNREFVFVEPSFLQPLGQRMVPTDPDYRRQWQHANDGSNGGLAGADIRSELAWEKTLGAGVRIAIIDNGMQISHPDLKAGIVGGGYFVDDGTGSATFVPRDARFPGGEHGTFCMGMAGARMNRVGGCGSAPESSLIPIACLDDQVGTQTTLARAVAYAANPTFEDATANPADGAQVIACSLGPNGATWDLTTVLDLAIQSAARTGRSGLGVTLFWAASNGPFPIESDEVSSHLDVIAVGRSNRNDLEDGSAFGSRLAFLAPGRDVFSTRQSGRYGISTGTSYACPLAAGVAALILALNPNLTRDQVLDKLRATCDKIGGVVYDSNGHHIEYGHGRINAARAVS